MTTTWVDGHQFMWVGDWGQTCGLTWYYSSQYVSDAAILTTEPWELG
jgi:hypothetical protein